MDCVLQLKTINILRTTPVKSVAISIILHACVLIDDGYLSRTEKYGLPFLAIQGYQCVGVGVNAGSARLS
jgi:hypothetical protein